MRSIKKEQEIFLKWFGKRKIIEWTEINRKTVWVVNEKFHQILLAVSHYTEEHEVRVDQIKEMVRELSEFHSGIYSILLPQNYPLIGKITELDLALENLIHTFSKGRKKFRLKLPDELAHNVLTTKAKLESYIFRDRQFKTIITTPR